MIENDASRVAATESPAADARLSQAIDEYRALLGAKERPNREAFLAAHADVGPELADALAGLEFVCAAVPDLNSSPGGPAGAVQERLDNGAPLGDFRIVREIARGGMGIVYEAEQLSLGRRVALKVLPFAATMDQRHLQRFQNEARAAASLHHPHIVPVHGVGCERGVHFFAMQYIDGFSLADLIRRLRSSPAPGPLTPAASASDAPTIDQFPAQGEALADTKARHSTVDCHPLASSLCDQRSSGFGQAYCRTVAQWGIQAADALEHAHQLGIVHRDIKPANLLIAAPPFASGRAADGHEAPTAHLWVADFGLARTGADSGLTMTGDLIGTLRYMSPEQALGKHGLVDGRGDIYSLGVTLYELLTLRPAVEGVDREDVLRKIAFEEPRAPGKIDRAIPHDLDNIVCKAMAKEPGERYASARELADDLKRFVECKPVKAKPPTMPQRLSKWARRNRPMTVAAAVALLFMAAVVGATGGIWYQQERTCLPSF